MQFTSHQPRSLKETASPWWGLTSPTRSGVLARLSLQEPPRNLEEFHWAEEWNMPGTGVDPHCVPMSNETAIGRGVVSRKLTPTDHVHSTHRHLPPTHQEQRKPLPLFYIFSPLSVQGKGKIIKSGASISPETFKCKLDQALPMYHRQQFHPGREVD